MEKQQIEFKKRVPNPVLSRKYGLQTVTAQKGDLMLCYYWSESRSTYRFDTVDVGVFQGLKRQLFKSPLIHLDPYYRFFSEGIDCNLGDTIRGGNIICHDFDTVDLSTKDVGEVVCGNSRVIGETLLNGERLMSGMKNLALSIFEIERPYEKSLPLLKKRFTSWRAISESDYWFD